ncbi:MAG: MXAN_5187 C-terminal domain-containing protein, partial [Candidatus Acidiferrales bacterium]
AQRATSLGASEPKRPAKGERPPPFSMFFSDPDHETKKIEQLYQKLVEIRTVTGEKGGTPSFEDFGKFVRQKTRELKSRKSASQVEYTVTVEDGRVKLKARVTG